ncbi:MBL fold metallo-hydrolase [Nocardiopsis sp. NPDC101807]|uniref:MBL fold metallo-hydrolase n=1 Tax=Nocardiopsis sp. NPDC101807 TaxID=3364339 RepID=UPI00380A4604
MFWKRKPKKQEGPEATDSAAEVAVDDKAAAGATDSGTAGATPSEEKDAVAEAAEKDTGRADGSGKDDGGAEAAADSAAGAPAAVTDEKSGEDGTPDADAETPAAGEQEPDADAETAGADGDAEDVAAEADEPVGLFADETEEAGVTGPDPDGITRVRSVGVFEFDDEKFDVVANTWIVKADDEGVIVIDPGYDAEAVLEAVGDREIYLVACTNAYGPHIESAIKVAEEADADIALHPREMRAWRRHHGAEHRPEIEVEGQGALDIADLHIDVLALPGTSSGSVGYYISELGVVFSGDALRKGEPGMVGNTYIDYTTQLASIGEALLSLPPDTRILPDRGPSTTSGAESKNFDSWV